MPEFAYRIREPNGGRRSGTIQASSRGAAVAQLRERGWIILRVDPLQQSRPAAGWQIHWPISELQVELSLQQMACMVRSGMTLSAALELLRDQSQRQSIGRVWTSLQHRLQGGMSLSQAMQSHRCFPEFAIQLVRIGEQTGNLAPVLERCVETMRRRRAARQEMISTAIYPVLVLLLAGAATVYMVAYLIPRLEVYLVSLGRQLPPMTNQLLSLAHGLRAYGSGLLLTLVLAVLALIAAWHWPASRWWIDRGLLRVPVLGRLLALRESSSFARVVGMLLSSGITLAECLRSVPALLGNHYLGSVVAQARERIMRGGQLAEALHRPHAFSPVLVRMIQVGEETGDLTRVLHEAAIYHESQFDGLARRVQALATPALTLFVGGVVGYVYVAFFVALFAGGVGS